MNAAEVAKALGGESRGSNGWWQARCPAHQDGTASLGLHDTADGHLAWKCMAGCDSKAVGDALKARGLLPERQKRAKPKLGPIIRTYDYIDAAGELVLQVVRYDKPKKDFRQRRPDPDKPGEWIWKLSGIINRPLYRLPELLAAEPAEDIYLVEGEKDVDRLRSLGLTATTSSQGAGNWKHTEPSPLFGRHVVILPDNDDSGAGYAAETGRDLVGKVASLRLLALPGVPAKGDVSDWLDAGGTVEELRRLAADAPAYGPPPAEDFERQLHRNERGEVRDVIFNATLILRIDEHFKGHIRYNLFIEAVEAQQLPWRDGGWAPWSDADDLQLAAWCQQRHAYLRPKTVADAVQVVARDVQHHPVRERLNALTWDGTPRLEGWLISYMGVADTAFARDAGKACLVSAVARIMQPGCKADHVLIFEGDQGIGKSTAAAVLAMDDAWFADEIADLGSKDAAQGLCGKWLIELGELSALRRGEVERVKAFVSRRVDHYRPSYGRRSQDFARQCIFVGSTNSDTYLQDETGNRRFWPVKCGVVDLDALKRDVGQLWAEAVVAYRDGAHWWLDKATEEEARKIQADRRIIDPWEELVMDWAEAQPNRVAIRDVMTSVLGMDYDRRDQQAQNRIARIFKANGWERRRDNDAGRAWRYERPTGTEPPTPEQTESSRVAGAFVAASIRSVPVSSHSVPVCDAPTGTEKASVSAACPSVPVCPSKVQTHTHAHTRAHTPALHFQQTLGQTGTTGTETPRWDDLDHWQVPIGRAENSPSQYRSAAKEWAIAAGATFDGYGMAVLPPDLPAGLAANRLRLVLLNAGLMPRGAIPAADHSPALRVVKF